MPYSYSKLPDQFTRDYIQAALWSTNDESDESGGVPLDENYGVEDIEDETVEDMILDCKEFQEANSADLDLVYGVSHGGHDFWLTRNGHGVGFRDRGYRQSQEIRDALDRLDRAASEWGEYNLWVGSSADLNTNTESGDPDSGIEDDEEDADDKKIYSCHTRASSARYEQKKKARERLVRRVTVPHARCENSKKCLEHAANKKVASCKTKGRHREEK